MKLIGMMDSPYVRRVAVSLALYGVEFESLPLSVFSGFDEFSRINPVVKAPTVVLDNGTQLMDSTLILHYFETTNPAGRRLLPTHPEALARDRSSARKICSWQGALLAGTTTGATGFFTALPTSRASCEASQPSSSAARWRLACIPTRMRECG